MSTKTNLLKTTAIPTEGILPIPMTNDYLFRALLQKNEKVLQGLICSLLHMREEEIVSVTIRNPIDLGASIDDKTFILDILIELNNNSLIDLEMQVINEKNWTERSLSYLCRNFDSLKKGVQYTVVQTVYQIGILNFTLFENNPEFYARYQFLNVRNHSVYSDKIQLAVLDLTQIHLATKEDRDHKIDYWARLFKATTWKELNMLAEQYPIIKDATETVFQLTQDEIVRRQCEAREEYYHRMDEIQKLLDFQAEKLAEKEALITETNEKLAEKEALITETNEKLAEKDARIAELEAQLASMKE